MTNIAKIPNVTRIKTWKQKKPRRTKQNSQKFNKKIQFNKIPDLQGKEAKKGPEMSANIAKIAKVTRIFLAS